MCGMHNAALFSSEHIDFYYYLDLMHSLKFNYSIILMFVVRNIFTRIFIARSLQPTDFSENLTT